MPIDQIKSRNGFGAVPTGSYTLLVSENYRRKWFSITCPSTAPAPMLVCLTYGSDVSNDYGLIYLHQGSSLILSATGDQPWSGSVLATGVALASYCYWTECYAE